MRIIGGAFRGRRLANLGQGDAGAHLRPTADRVRESLFNILQSHAMPQGARILDLFAGTGGLGLEALSRGAVSASFVENGRVALSVLRENIALCRVEAQSEIFARDARRLGPGAPHDLIFLDPPYGKGLGQRALAAAFEGGWVAPGALIVWEENLAPPLPAGCRLIDERRYGDTLIRILRNDG